jgi:hypothetical protein
MRTTPQRQTFEVAGWCVTLQHPGRSKTFALTSANKEIAAAKAKQIYLTVVGQGWEAAETIYDPGTLFRKYTNTMAGFGNPDEAASTQAARFLAWA